MSHVSFGNRKEVKKEKEKNAPPQKEDSERDLHYAVPNSMQVRSEILQSLSVDAHKISNFSRRSGDPSRLRELERLVIHLSYHSRTQPQAAAVTLEEVLPQAYTHCELTRCDRKAQHNTPRHRRVTIVEKVDQRLEDLRARGG